MYAACHVSRSKRRKNKPFQEFEIVKDNFWLQIAYVYYCIAVCFKLYRLAECVSYSDGNVRILNENLASYVSDRRDRYNVTTFVSLIVKRIEL